MIYIRYFSIMQQHNPSYMNQQYPSIGDYFTSVGHKRLKLVLARSKSKQTSNITLYSYSITNVAFTAV